jgi:hypothetical protein
MTSWEMPDISTGLHANISLLHLRKLMSLLSYLRSKLALICMVFVGSPALICTALASSSVLKVPDVGGVVGLRGLASTWRLKSLSSTVATAAAASSRLSCSQSSVRYVLASTVMTPAGPSILSLR